MKQTIYTPRPVSEKPKEEGKYTMMRNDSPYMLNRWIGNTWWEDPHSCTHWLEPIEVDILKMVEDAFQAGLDWYDAQLEAVMEI